MGTAMRTGATALLRPPGGRGWVPAPRRQVRGRASRHLSPLGLLFVVRADEMLDKEEEDHVPPVAAAICDLHPLVRGR